MEQDSSVPGTPGVVPVVPLQPVSPERVNQQRESQQSPSARTRDREGSIHEKIQQFNTLSQVGLMTATSMSKQLERKTADAALKRAMLGREEAETDMRKYREEALALQKQVEEGLLRERKVGERLESVMELYGRAKETYSHTQALWEKEIRRARKETFKSQSAVVKLQEELKAARAAAKSSDEILEREKERTKAREQEAFTARYQLVGVQEQLDQARERVKVVEQERDAYKTLAKEEEVARIAAEGRLPLPRSEDEDDEFASPKKDRESLPAADVLSSAASEAEIEELTRLWQWEKQRADRAAEHVEFLQAECQLRCCSCARSPKSRARRSTAASARKRRSDPVAIVDPADLVIMGLKSRDATPTPAEITVIRDPTPEANKEEVKVEVEMTEAAESAVKREQPEEAKEEPSRTTIFLPGQGTFRTLSQQDLQAMDVDEESSKEALPRTETHQDTAEYARTPSVDPPAFALTNQERTSLLSLLNAPRQSEVRHAEGQALAVIVPTTPVSRPIADQSSKQPQLEIAVASPEREEDVEPQQSQMEPRPHTSASFYTVTETTTVPLHDDNADSVPYAVRGLHSQGRQPSFDINNPALTPTMTREEALAQIRARRGRARSAANGTMTPRKQMFSGVGKRRDMSSQSEPAGRARRGRS